jgi:hypothetical protein
MGFEALPDDIESFFNTGEVPEGLKGEMTPVEPVEVETPVEAAVPVEPQEPAADPVVPATPAPDYSSALASQQQKLDALVKQLSDMQAAEKAKIDEANKPIEPDPQKDPLGYLTHQIKQVGDQVKAMQDSQVQSKQQTEQQTAAQKFQEAVVGMVEEYKKTTPDYMDAYKYLIDLRTADFQVRGMSPSEIQQALGAEEGNILQNAIRQGKNPAELAYTLAKKYGYVQKSAAAVPAEKAAGSKLDTIKKGMETAGVERAAPPSTYSTDAVKGMNTNQLNEAVEHHWDEMFGRPGNKSIF